MRYTFDSPSQAHRHVHVADGRQLVFFPDPFLDVRVGQPAIIEICFSGTDQSLTARGEVHSIDIGVIRGAWLEVSSLRLFDGLEIARAPPRRMFRRLPTDMLVRTGRAGATSAMARLTDVSGGGARVSTAGAPWNPGEEIFISDLSGGPSLCGTVARVRDGEVAVAFVRSDATTRRNAVRLVNSAIERWRDARETRHPAACGCARGGALFEPLVPRSARRRVQGL
ncbi:MAG: PilZ domain-containing protein [Myxococcales bacterium]|nr:PilZ domain-containing protein [Myxococcales bacterium]